MQAKQYLQQVRRAEAELKLLRAKKRHFEDLAASLGSGIGSATAKPSGASRTEAAAVGLVDLTEQLDAKIAEFTKIVVEAEERIAKIPQDRYRQVLTLRYISGWTWRSISDEMNYKDPKSVYRVHGWALRELQKFM